MLTANSISTGLFIPVRPSTSRRRSSAASGNASDFRMWANVTTRSPGRWIPS